MNLESALAQMLQLTSSLDLRVLALLLAVCAIGEFGLSIPYVLESVWLLAGYQLGAGALSPLHLLALWLAAQLGRQAGATALFCIGRFSSAPLARLQNSRWLSRFTSRVANSRVASRINLASPFSVAYARLLWLKIPMTLTLGVKRRLGTLSAGVLISSVVWDTVYISVGLIVGSTAAIEPVYMLLYSLAGLTLMYLATVVVRQVIRRLQPATGPATHSPAPGPEDSDI